MKLLFTIYIWTHGRHKDAHTDAHRTKLSDGYIELTAIGLDKTTWCDFIECNDMETTLRHLCTTF